MAEQEPRTGEEPPAQDVLAAEAFAVPAPDPGLHHADPVVLPEDPTGLDEPHDVLAAEEFPMPAPRSGGAGLSERRGGRTRLAVEALAALLVVATVLRRRGR